MTTWLWVSCSHNLTPMGPNDAVNIRLEPTGLHRDFLPQRPAGGSFRDAQMGCPSPEGARLCGEDPIKSKAALKAKLTWVPIWPQLLLSREALVSHFTSLRLGYLRP